MSKRSLQSGVSPTEPPTPRRAAALAANWITKKGAEDAAGTQSGVGSLACWR